MGHYVLGHVWKGLLFQAAVFFVLLYLGFRSIGWMLGRWGAGWRIRGLDDWASLPALLLLLSIFSFLSDPISNAYSRHIEHQADVYGLEVTHGVIPNAGQAAADSFQVEGETSLDDPDPNPVNVFLFYDHPPISDRARLCLTYDPWVERRRTTVREVAREAVSLTEAAKRVSAAQGWVLRKCASQKLSRAARPGYRL